MVRRCSFAEWTHNGDMVTDVNGKWVSFADYDRLATLVRELAELLSGDILMNRSPVIRITRTRRLASEILKELGKEPHEEA